MKRKKKAQNKKNHNKGGKTLNYSFKNLIVFKLVSGFLQT